LTIVTSPAGATISVNGSQLNDPSPTTYSNLEIGKKYRIVAKLPGYDSWEKEIIPTDRDERVVGSLAQILVTLKITSEPTGAEVYLNGSSSTAGRTPLNLIDKPPATVRQVEVRKDGYKEVKRVLDWSETRTRAEIFNLRKK
jgi:hypothetical protein